MMPAGEGKRSVEERRKSWESLPPLAKREETGTNTNPRSWSSMKYLALLSIQNSHLRTESRVGCCWSSRPGWYWVLPPPLMMLVEIVWSGLEVRENFMEYKLRFNLWKNKYKEKKLIFQMELTQKLVEGCFCTTYGTLGCWQPRTLRWRCFCSEKATLRGVFATIPIKKSTKQAPSTN